MDYFMLSDTGKKESRPSLIFVLVQLYETIDREEV